MASSSPQGPRGGETMNALRPPLFGKGAAVDIGNGAARRVNWKRILVLWVASLSLLATLNLAYYGARSSAYEPEETSDPTVLQVALSSATRTVEESWRVDLVLSGHPHRYAPLADLPLTLRLEGEAAVRGITLWTTLMVNGVVARAVSFSGIWAASGPASFFADYGPGDPDTLRRVQDALRAGTNEIVVSLEVTLPPGEGAFEAGPLGVDANPIDVSGDGLVDLHQLLPGVHLLLLFVAVAPLALGTLLVLDLLLQRRRDRGGGRGD